MKRGVNLEFTRTEKLTLEEGIETASEIGYEYVEAYVYVPVEAGINSHTMLKTEQLYSHIDSSRGGVSELKVLLNKHKMQFSAVNAHTAMLIPDIGIPHLIKAIDIADQLGCPLVITDEGPVSQYWTSLDRAFDEFCGNLEKVVSQGRERGIQIAVEPHNAITTTKEYLHKLLDRFAPDDVGINFDTGNAFLSGNDPLDLLSLLMHRVVHVHAKDPAESWLPERGGRTGIRVGTAFGDGILDAERIILYLMDKNFSGVVSVECDTSREAERSYFNINSWITAGDKRYE
jgi:3-oxoisoapionate decarboxylase